MRSPLFYKALLAAGGAVALGLVFMLYANPHLMVRFAEQLWACF